MGFWEIVLILSLIATPILEFDKKKGKKSTKRKKELYYIIDEDGKIIWLEK